MRTESLQRAVLLVLLAASGPAAADWKREYDRGLKAVQDGDWAEAQARFEQALREDGTPLERKRFEGVRVSHYVPHYFAGLAAYRQGNCEKAVEYWNHAATAAVLGKLAEFRAEQQRGLDTCRTRLAQASAPATPPASTPAATPAASAPVSTAAVPPAGTTRPPASSAGPASAAPTSTPATASPTRPVASTAPATSAPAASAPPRPAPATAGAAPAVLRSAVDAYLAGRYTELQRVDASTAPDARARAQLHLLRAAAGFTLAQSSGDGDAALEAVRRDVRAARAAMATLTPDPVLFSPRFRTFWQQTR